MDPAFRGVGARAGPVGMWWRSVGGRFGRADLRRDRRCTSACRVRAVHPAGTGRCRVEVRPDVYGGAGPSRDIPHAHQQRSGAVTRCRHLPMGFVLRSVFSYRGSPASLRRSVRGSQIQRSHHHAGAGDVSHPWPPTGAIRVHLHGASVHAWHLERELAGVPRRRSQHWGAGGGQHVAEFAGVTNGEVSVAVVHQDVRLACLSG